MEFIPKDIQPFVVIGIIFSMFLTIYRNWVKPADAFLYAIIALVLSGILTPEEAIIGFSNTSIFSVFLLILITAGLKNSFNLETYIYKIFDVAKTYRSFLIILMGKVALLSSFVNNTPIVALMTPYVMSWGKKHNISPSRLLIPMSFATITGGMITIIGTSTTLVLNGFLLEYEQVGLQNLDFIMIGLPVAFVTIIGIALLAPFLLPDKKDILKSFTSNTREYLVEKRLNHDSPLIGQTVEGGGLRNMKGVYLVEIIRNKKSITPVTRDEVIEANDILIFAGNTETIMDISDDSLGTTFPKQVASMQEKIEMVEVVVSSNSSLIGRTIKESEFRNRYDAAVVAVHRGGERLLGKIGEIELQAGDVLLLYTGQNFDDRIDIYKDLLAISEIRKQLPNKQNINKLLVLLGVLAFLLFTQWYSLFSSLLIIASVMVAFKMITLRTLKRDLDYSMVVILVFSIALGEAMIKTDAGELIASEVIRLLSPLGVLPVLIGIMLMTILLTSFISNVGAVAIMFPLVLSVANSMDMAHMPFYLVIAFGASASFLTPIGYQTNLMVYGPGGYSFKDFLRIGFPTAVIYSMTSLIFICLLYQKELFGS